MAGWQGQDRVHMAYPGHCPQHEGTIRCRTDSNLLRLAWRHRGSSVLLAVAVLILLGAGRFQFKLRAAAPAAREDQAKSSDVRSIEAITAALYDTISGPAGTRDWGRLRSLFLPGARLIPSGRRPDGNTVARVLSVNEFITAIERNVKDEGFFEQEISRRIDKFGAVAHVFSTYESRHAKSDAKPFVRGINSIQLFFDGKRWWVVTIFWDSERPDQPIPAEYLPRSRSRQWAVGSRQWEVGRRQWEVGSWPSAYALWFETILELV